jgi:two-component system nitrate/nitrite response regulator NarL
LKDVDPVTLARAIEDACSGRFLLDDSLTRRVILRLGSALNRQPRPVLPSPLTEREAGILQMVVQGKSNRQIGAQLEVSEGTVKSHLRNIYRKLQVQTRAEAAARGARLQG